MTNRIENARSPSSEGIPRCGPATVAASARMAEDAWDSGRPATGDEFIAPGESEPPLLTADAGPFDNGTGGPGSHAAENGRPLGARIPRTRTDRSTVGGWRSFPGDFAVARVRVT